MAFTILSSSTSTSSSSSLENYFSDHSSRILQSKEDENGALDFGFLRANSRESKLAGTVEFYHRHVFLCYKSPAVWPPRIDDSDFDRLPRLLSAAIVARKGDINKETHLTLCEGNDETETSNGDVLIFPDMIRYRRLTHFDVEAFVEEVLINGGECFLGKPEPIEASYIFVCSHGSRDRECGAVGPVLVSRFREEIKLHGLGGKVLVSPCSHIGNHSHAGNVIIFGSSINGKVTGHWYGNVTPEEVPLLFQQHIIKGEILDLLWRGQMGSTVDEQKKKHEQRIHLFGARHSGESIEHSMHMQHHEISTAICRSQGNSVGCCQESEYSSCNQNDDKLSENVLSKIKNGKEELRNSWRDFYHNLECWEQEDTYAAVLVACAAASVAFAYNCYKQL